MFKQTEIKQEVSETIICKREIGNEVDDVLQDNFKTEIKEEPIHDSTNDTFDYLDVKKYPIKAEIEQDDGANYKTITEWCNLFRKVCSKSLEMHPLEIGGFSENGEPITVEIDLHKHHQAACTEERWLFGGVERDSGKLFIIPVAARNEETLLPIISRMILPGSIIVSDVWSGYDNIGHLGSGVYEHRICNLVDCSDDSVHTRSIESVWLRTKKKLAHCETSRFELYLDEFIWRELTKNCNQFTEFLMCLAEQYVV
ncbi:uncharacterized protein LOC114332573 isoform X2 [Diabrotica virgifera virgifera]|uniref:ISXO2-like transposase domain-containing protein n=2 Tax=Diabrotica virgifera virgifera TaxID=50390 RepID=A0ABM5JYN2_DIAVI|nr:uncharacterized protein LOC114332573 isoform X2 [Diabrotica virgifera virgifera]